MPRDFYPFVEEGGAADESGAQGGGLEVSHPARVAVYDDAAAAPRVVVVEPKGPREYLEEITATVSRLAREQGGSIPFMVIREIVENFVHAYFQAPTISILDGGNTIRFSDQGPGIREKDLALEYGTSSATEEMKRYIRGVGSGLPYVQQYMEDKGGSLSIEDNIAGGTVVTISTRPADEAPVRSEAAAARDAAQGQQAQPSWPQGSPAQAPYGWQQAPAPAPWGWSQAPQPYQTGAYQAQPAAWQQAAAAPAPSQPSVPAQVPQATLGDRGRLALSLVLERGSAGPTDLVKAYGSSAATWSRELAALAAQGAVLKSGQKYQPTEYGRALGGLL